MALKLKACDICGAVTSKDDEGFHLRWHAELERSLTAVAQVREWCTDDQAPAVHGTYMQGYHAARRDVLRRLDDTKGGA